MKLTHGHLAYCTNIHRGESWADTGTQGVCDYDAYRKAMEGMDGEAYFSKYEAQLCTAG